MKPMGDLDALLARAVEKGSSGPRCARSSPGPTPRASQAVAAATVRGVGAQILGHGLVPIIPEVDIKAPEPVRRS